MDYFNSLLAKICNAVASTDDPSEFSLWLTALQIRSLSTQEYGKFVAVITGVDMTQLLEYDEVCASAGGLVCFTM